MVTNGGTDIVERPGTLVRLEDGTWMGLGWSNASQGRIYRPNPAVFDEDAWTLRPQ